jgi:hypothetical protein
VKWPQNYLNPDLINPSAQQSAPDTLVMGVMNNRQLGTGSEPERAGPKHVMGSVTIGFPGLLLRLGTTAHKLFSRVPYYRLFW